NPGSFVVRTAAGGTSFEYAPVDGPLVSQATTESATFTVRHKVGGYEIDEYSNLPYSAGLPALP
ncbi:MAG: hypothetical protein ACXVRH_09760, partial [Thermoleophilaceae bacterium]